MNADQLLANYERIAGAPNAVQRLRSFILDLAVRGKLVPQDPNEVPASELLKEIAEEKARLVKAGVIKNSKAVRTPLAEISPFTLPDNWRWSQVAEIGVLSPRNEAADGAQVSFVPMALISAEYGMASAHEIRNWREIKKGYTHFAEGDVGLAKITPCFENGKSTVFWSLTGGLGSGTTELHIVRPLFVNATYVLLFLKSPRFIAAGLPKMTGTAGQKRLPAEHFANSPFPLPPLAEQHRIVAKVDELMALCDQLEAARAEREATRNHLAAISLARLNTPDPDGAVFQSHVVFTLENLGHVTARPGQIKAFRQTILNLAVRGKLLPQDPNDEPASELLKEIAAEKARLTKTTGIKKPWPESPVSPNDTSFSLPSGWAWSTIGWISSKTGSGSTPRGGKEAYKPSGVAFLRSQNIYDDGLRLNDVAYIDRATHERMASTAIEASDLLLNITGGSIGRCCLVPDDLGEANINQHVAIIRPAIKDTARFFHSWVLSPYFQAFIFDEQTGAGRGGLPKNRMDRIPVALPPLTEQYRIVAKVDELMALCDQLEAMLSIGDDTRRRLLDALLHEALEPTNPTRNNLVPNRNSEALEGSMSIG